jgi:hypothetical protein
MSDKRISKRGLEQLMKDAPEKFDPLHSYGIIPRQTRPADTVYWLDYDPRFRYLKLNGVVVRQFQLESNADIYFTKLFKKTGWVKSVKVDKPARASVLVNNTNIPTELRNAMFDLGANESLLEVHTVIRRSDAKKFRVDDVQVDNFLVECKDQHYALVKSGKRK